MFPQVACSHKITQYKYIVPSYSSATKLDFRGFLVRGRSAGSFPEQRLVIEKRHMIILFSCANVQLFFGVLCQVLFFPAKKVSIKYP